MTSLWSTRFCYQVFIVNNQPNFCVLLSVQILPKYSFILPPARGFPHQAMSKQSLISESWCSGLVAMRVPSAPGIYSLLLSALQYSFDKYMISSLSLASVAANASACSFPFAKSESTFQHIPPLEKFSHAFAKRLTSSTKSSFLHLHAVDSFCFSLMTPTALNLFVGQEILSADLYFCLYVVELLCEFQQIIWLVLCQTYLDGRTLKQELLLILCFYGSNLSFIIAISQNSWQFYNNSCNFLHISGFLQKILTLIEIIVFSLLKMQIKYFGFLNLNTTGFFHIKIG